MKMTSLFKLFTVALVSGSLCMPFTGCGVESEPLGVEDDADAGADEMDPEYIEGEEEL